MELDLILALANKSRYNKLYGVIPKDVLTDETRTILRDMGDYLKTRDSVDWKEFSQYFRVIKHGAMKQEQREAYSALFKQLEQHELKEEVEKDLLFNLENKACAARLIDASEALLEDAGSFEDIQDVLDKRTVALSKYQKITTKVVGGDLEEALNATYRSGGLEWNLEDLNRSLGPIHKGDMGVICGRGESGKTTLAIQEVAHMIRQLPKDKHAVIINNEEEDYKLILRAYNTVLGVDTHELNNNSTDSMARYVKAMGSKDRLKVYGGPTLSVGEIDQYCAENEPALIVFNMLAKVNGFNTATNDVERQRMLAQWARELAKTYGPVICLVQAGEEGENKKEITQNMVYGSKTGVPTESDFFIGIGHLHGVHDKRYLNIARNKLPGGPRSDKKLRHALHEVRFDGDIGRYSSFEFNDKSVTF